MVIHPFSPVAAAGLLAALAFAWGMYVYLSELILTPPLTRAESVRFNGLMGMFALLFAVLGVGFYPTSAYLSAAAFVVLGAVFGHLFGRGYNVRMNGLLHARFAVVGAFCVMFTLICIVSGTLVNFVLGCVTAVAVGQLAGVTLRSHFAKRVK